MYVEKICSDDSELSENQASEVRYIVHGQVFFNSASKLIANFDFKEGFNRVVIDVHKAHFWDISAAQALSASVAKFRRQGAEVEVIGLNEASETIIDRFGLQEKPEELDRVLAS